MNPDRIEKEVLLRAPLDHVVPGTSVVGIITPTTVDEDVATAQEPHAGKADAWHIVAVEPQRRLAFRWHPFGVESGFDAIPAERRRSAFESNSEGWSGQTELIRKYLALSEKV